jgi:hypothetical protein
VCDWIFHAIFCSAFLSWPYTIVSDYSNFVASFQTRKCKSAVFDCLLKIWFDNLDSFHLNINFRTSLFTSKKRPTHILMKNILNFLVVLRVLDCWTWYIHPCIVVSISCSQWIIIFSDQMLQIFHFHYC